MHSGLETSAVRSPGALSEGPGGCEGRIRGTAAPVCGHLCRAGVQMFLTAERRLFCPSKTLDTPFESLVTEPGWLALVRDPQPPLKGRHCRWLSGKKKRRGFYAPEPSMVCGASCYVCSVDCTCEAE